MNLSLTEEQMMIQDMAKKFAESELAPVAAELDETQDQTLFLNKLAQLTELGFMGLNIKAEYGGVEAGTVAFSLAITEIARACASTAVTTSVTNMVAEVIQAVGNEDQKQNYLPKICSGEYKAGAFCLTENSAGSDPAGMKTSAVLDGNEYVLNGSKLYITSASFADIFVVWAVTDPTARKGKGISCFLVEANTPGITVSKPEDKMGQKASPTNEVNFNDCRIPASAMMGKENKGFGVAVGELAGGRIGIGSLALGIGLAAMDYARAFITERQQFGQALSNFQGLQWKLAERYTDLEAARLLLMQAAYTKEQGLPFGKSASMAKLFAAEKANIACYDALQLMGGAGYIKEYPLERMARDVRITTIYEGTSEIQKIIIARELLSEV
ncbi:MULTISPECIES: acyl-CoA dehydrogenase family protein [unclassified Colwellia]|jgi:alkylation response protein AidB-like acyl-CoA dehydrogenase|uniref:acyl-CoA dehydrogenase family protein n=1 Tax=unclassified Colwellia TaxID=196834 RepID=UPI0015F40CD2|nr:MULTISPECIES: acyl-CoA dehydrogenase family protein [unclassified Colwellia]MBA6233160.1 acyl-CoA dehydrogenase family protein [Colwellia sp. MB02u-7]MBA6236250.1 acyl-CoA dehydrogenase family protein [Colwellia sp. MB02u-11]MBA6256789.1 acyl-CoA dehydrogenase family protein [Colwellia sp. MB3u-28]MBA6261205.1 acyl-CoA dehydrogenase family protein [Colwellia sp. MB3u-41]MBA6264072.1 acyl-CoA dehydrogenase family protein [Colwellia sp. Bg11-12]